MGGIAPIPSIDEGRRIKVAKTAAYVRAAGFSGEDLITALAIAKAESAWNPSAVSAANADQWQSVDYGLFQINSHWHPISDAAKTNPVLNAREAYRIYKADGGFKAWATYQNGAYKAHLDAAREAVAELDRRGAAFEKRAVAFPASTGPTTHSEGVNVSELPTGVNLNPLDGLQAMAANVGSALNNISLVLVGIVFLVLGVLLIARQPIGETVSKVIPMARAVAK